jgi:hypothetical protein
VSADIVITDVPYAADSSTATVVSQSFGVGFGSVSDPTKIDSSEGNFIQRCVGRGRGGRAVPVSLLATRG